MWSGTVIIGSMILFDKTAVIDLQPSLSYPGILTQQIISEIFTINVQIDPVRIYGIFHTDITG